MTYKEREVEFLKELTALSKKYRIDISGCGCCGSPYLDDITDFKGIYPSKSVDIEEYEYVYKDHLRFSGP